VRAAAPVCRLVGTDPAALASHRRIRHEVFVEEQRIFDDSDGDGRDDDPATVRVLATVQGEPAGTVRCYQLGGGTWQGDRLAVRRRFRRAGVAVALVEAAVAAAAAGGGDEMVACVQVTNVRFFEGLGWRRRGDPVPYADGRPHQVMVRALTPSGPGGGPPPIRRDRGRPARSPSRP